MANEAIPNLKGVKIGNVGSPTKPAPVQRNIPKAPNQPVPQQKSTPVRQQRSEVEKIFDTTVKSAARSFGTRLVTALMKNIFGTKKK